MKRYVGSIYGRANAPENVWAVLGWVHAQTWINMINSSVIHTYDARINHIYPCLGMYSSKRRPSRPPQTARKLKVFDEVKGWSSEATDVKYNNYMLLALIFDWFIELFVPFTSLCPNLSPISFDIATSQKRRNVKWNRILIWTQSSKWDK